VPYLLISAIKPFLPIPVCFSLRISINVPTGNKALVSGTNVTLVRSLKDLVKVTPCFARRPIAQLSFSKSLMNFLPEMVKPIREH